MRKSSFFKKCFLFAVLLTLFAACTQPKERYVVVLSVDGFRSDYPEKYATPTLDSLARAGVRSSFRPSYPSNTFPNHYAMATGLHPDHHGLVNNSFYAAELNKIYSIGNREAVGNPDFYGGEPIWNTVQRQGLKAASFYWVGSETAVNGAQPSIWKPFDSSVPFKNRADSVIAWLQLPEEIRPRLIMWYSEEPDGVGHKVGPDGLETKEMVEELDRTIGYFFAEARKLPIFDQIDFIVLSDHGMADYHIENYVNLGNYLPRDSFEYVFDGVPTALYPKSDTYVDQALEILKTVPHVTAYRKSEIPERFIYGTHPRIGEIVVIPDIGTYLHFRTEDRPFTGATHGYDNFTPEMQAIFYATGPSFAQNKVTPVMPNVNLYLLICRLLGVEPAPNDGKDDEIAPLFRK